MPDESPRYLEPGGIRQLDHILLLCPKKGAAEVIAFWRGLGLEPHNRFETGPIDHAGAGRRIDFALGRDTQLTYHVTAMPKPLVGALHWAREHLDGHIALRVGPEDIKALLAHPALDTTQGKRGLIRWGTCDFSLFLNGPHGLRVEFRCPSAPADLDRLLD